MQHLRALATIIVLTACLPANAGASPTDAATIKAIEAAATRCVRKNDYIGPIRFTQIESVNAKYAVVTLSLGVSGDSAARIVMQRVGASWTCTTGDGGVISTGQLQRAHVPTQLDHTIITGRGSRPLLKTPAPSPRPRPKPTAHDSDADRLFGPPSPTPSPHPR